MLYYIHFGILIKSTIKDFFPPTANEGRIEAVCEAGMTLLEENTPEADRVKQKIEDIRGLWDDLKELAIARQEVSRTMNIKAKLYKTFT